MRSRYALAADAVHLSIKNVRAGANPPTAPTHTAHPCYGSDSRHGEPSGDYVCLTLRTTRPFATGFRGNLPPLWWSSDVTCWCSSRGAQLSAALTCSKHCGHDSVSHTFAVEHCNACGSCAVG